MSAIPTALPDEPFSEYEDAGPITDEEIEFCAAQSALRLDYEEAGPLPTKIHCFAPKSAFSYTTAKKPRKKTLFDNELGSPFCRSHFALSKSANVFPASANSFNNAAGSHAAPCC